MYSGIRSRGVTILGYLLVFSSLGQMTTLLSLDNYRYLFHHLPGNLLTARYVISWGLRIAGLIAGAGILRLSEKARKLAILIFCVTIAGVCVKNSYVHFSRLTQRLDQLPISIALGGPGVFSSMTRPAVITARVLDILFAAGVIYFLTRPQVKQQFINAAVNTPCRAGLLENFLARKRAQTANLLIPPQLRGGAILDIGCGAPAVFLANTNFREKYGIDDGEQILSPDKNIIFKKHDLEKNSSLPFPDHFFDVVTMLAVFEHIETGKLGTALKETRRVLKPGGRFILTTPCPWAKPLLQTMARLKLISRKSLEEHKDLYSPLTVARRLREAGFAKEKIKTGYFEMFLNGWIYADG